MPTASRISTCSAIPPRSLEMKRESSAVSFDTRFISSPEVRFEMRAMDIFWILSKTSSRRVTVIWLLARMRKILRVMPSSFCRIYTPNMQAILTALWEEVVPALSPSPLPEAPATQAELRETLERLAVPVATGNEAPRRLRRNFEFSPNACGIVSCAVETERDECALTFRFADGTMEQLRAGFGKFVSGTFKLTDRYPHPTAASAAWQEGKLVIESFILDGIFRSNYTVDFTPGVAEPITRKDLCSTFRHPWETLTLK